MIAVLVAALLAPAAGAARSRVAVARQATVAGDAIRLDDIAAVEGEEARALGALVIGPAPAPGEQRALAGTVVLGALRRGAGTLEDIAYTIPPTVHVRRASQEVGEPALRRIVEDFLAGAAGDAMLRTLEAPERIVLPVGGYRARVIPPPTGTPLMGRVRLEIEFVVDGAPSAGAAETAGGSARQRAWVTADIGLFGPVVVARRPVARGARLEEADLAVDRRDLSQAPRGVAGDMAEVVGRVASAPIAAYAPIRRDQVTVPAAVRRGDVVLLVAERGGLRITAPGEVHADAGLGEQVRVVNRATRKLLIGRVVDSSTVGVDF